MIKLQLNLLFLLVEQGNAILEATTQAFVYIH